MKVSYLQYDVMHDVQKNIAHIKKCLNGMEHNDVVILPELSMSGYLFKNKKELSDCAELVPSGTSTQAMIALSKQFLCTIIFGVAEKDGEKLFNTAVIVSKGRYIGKYRKIHLSDFEKKVFDSGNENKIFEVEGIKIGVQICFDLWFPEMSREQVRMGANILFVLANFGGETTYHITKVRAIENLTPLVLCNRVGFESIPGMDAEFLGMSTIVDQFGQRICTAPAGVESFNSYDIDVTTKKSNVICNDFDSEIAFHYQQ